MDVTPLVKTGTQIIQSYAGGAFKVSGVSYDTPIIVLSDQTLSWISGKVFADLTVGDFAVLADRTQALDVVLLGCGAQMRLLDPALRADLKARGLSVDVMDTGAACRTYNVLVAEGRRVAAALLPAV
ncbi:MAG: Mth938-like domain-containing protein [Alphaproteobacteria bacterium]|nr:Mth938-like domain-containing protein [Alphaproteobacteria bacterium]